mmetsp:Transcript_27446/g.50009  ORF Transcript_27446/g.50009 Transcript_27446/m.50009 type:complete len:659 (+) Transcript_27446:199-2175(+)
MFCVILISMQLAGLVQAEQSSIELLPEAEAAPVKEVCEPSANSVTAALASSLNLDETLYDAFHEAIVVLTVFGVASLLLRMFPFRRLHPPAQTANKASPRLAAKAAEFGEDPKLLPEAHQSSSSQSGDGKQSSTLRLAAQRPPARRVDQRCLAADVDALANAARTGYAGELPKLLDQAYARATAARGAGDEQALQDVAEQHLLAVLRACASAHQFREALAAYDHMAEQRRIGVGSGAVWSVLLYNTTEAGAFTRGEVFFKRLCKCHRPSSHDFVNVVRCYVHTGNLAGLKQMLADLHAMGHTVDAYARNRALAACTSTACEGALNFAEAIVTDGKSCEALDAIGYNTLMKYHARAGSLNRCFELRADMSAKGLVASDVTFGILLDACVGAKDFDRARRVFEELCNSGLALNVVHCTTFLKGLVNAGRLDEAHDVLNEMLRSPGTKPDLITYSTLVKAYADRSDVSAALQIVEQMVQQGIRPDEIICHCVLTGCCSEASSIEVMPVFNELVSLGMMPTTMTFSILLKALAAHEEYTEALKVLAELPPRFGLVTEARLFAQVAQAGIRAHRGDVAVEAYSTMLEAAKKRGDAVDPAISSRLLRHCTTHGEMGAAGQIREAAARAGLNLDQHTSSAFSDVSARRGPPKGSWRKEAPKARGA